VRLPGQHGIDFHQAAIERWPALRERFVFITGDAGSRELSAALNATGCPILRKPFSIESLVAQVRPLFSQALIS
jgi:two-component system NtrC family sensor kinase